VTGYDVTGRHREPVVSVLAQPLHHQTFCSSAAGDEQLLLSVGDVMRRLSFVPMMFSGVSGAKHVERL